MENINAIYQELNLLFINFEPDFLIKDGSFSVTRLVMVCDKMNKETYLTAIDGINYQGMENLAKHHDEVNSMLSSSLRRAAIFLETRRENYLKSIDNAELIARLYDEKKDKLIQELSVLVKTNEAYMDQILVHDKIAKTNNSKIEMNNTARGILVEHCQPSVRAWLETQPYGQVKAYYDHYEFGELEVVFSFKGFVDELLKTTLSAIRI